MKLKRMCGLLALLTVFVLAGCSFGPDMPEAPKIQANDDAVRLEYLALLKAMGSYTIGTDELERQITQLFENQESFGRSAAPEEKTVITGSKKLPITEKSNKSRSAASEDASLKFAFSKTEVLKKALVLCIVLTVVISCENSSTGNSDTINGNGIISSRIPDHKM